MNYTREKWMDAAKGISMLCVIVGHVSGGLTGFWNFHFVYGFHLVMFFLLSGYTIKKQAITSDYINKKFSRLMKPYFYTCIAVMVMDVWNSYFFYHDFSIATITSLIGKDIVRSFFASGSSTIFGTIEIGSRIGAIWFFPAIFFAIMFFQCLLQITEESWKLGSASFCISVLGYIMARFIWFPFSIQAGMAAMFFLWVGYEIHQRNLLVILIWRDYAIALILFLFGVFYHYANIGFVVADFNDIIFSVLIGFSGCLLVYYVSYHVKGSRILCWIGENSSLVLCTHLFTLETMGRYIDSILNRLDLSGNSYVWALIFMEMFCAVITAWLIKVIFPIMGQFFSKLQVYTRSITIVGLNNESAENQKRDYAIDIAKGCLIVLMIIGHFSIDTTLRKIIYSFHMTAFVFLSGYFYKENSEIKRAIGHIIHAFLIPYIVFVFYVLIKNIRNWSSSYIIALFKQYLLGMSFSSNIFSDVPSIGPIYFVLMLFGVRALYIFIDKSMRNTAYKYIMVFMVSFIGMKLGQRGYWLPWSFDITLYILVYYHLGFYCKKYNVLTKIKENHLVYFLFTPIWAYMIYCGSMEIAVRDYGKYGVVVIGSICGILIFCKGIYHTLYRLSVLSKVMAFAGNATFIILALHTLIGNDITRLVSRVFNENHVPCMVFSIVIQIILGMIMKYLFENIYGVYEKMHRGNSHVRSIL